jgi:dihydroxy-acid dehydratase
MSESPFDPPDAGSDDPAGMRKGLTSYGDAGFSLFLRKAFIKGAGYTDAALDRPVIGIADTGSGYNPCHGNMPQLVEAVQRGVMLAGGLPVKFPTISVDESYSHTGYFPIQGNPAFDQEFFHFISGGTSARL